MKTYRIFFASSTRLKSERDAFIHEINKLNDEFHKRGAYLHLDIWEKFDAANDPNRKQDFYNSFIKKSDIFVVAYWGELGAFTLEEYQQAEALFIQTGRPKIYLFKYKKDPDFDLRPENVESLKALEKVWYARPKAQWPWEFENTDAFIGKISGDIQNRFKDPNDKVFIFETTTLSEQGQAAVPKNFKGREAELSSIKQKLDDGGRLVVLKGEGGIGKSTLASKYLEKHGEDYQNKAWIFCEKGLVQDLMALVNDPEYFKDCVNEAQITTKLKTFLLGMPSNTILVLDNMNNKADYDTYQQHFRQLKWHVLATSRIGQKLEEEFPIKHLPPPIAQELFCDIYTEEGPYFEEKLPKLLEAVGYNTLLIEVISKHLNEAYHARGESLKTFLDKFEKEGLTLKTKGFTFNTNYIQNVHKTEQFKEGRASIESILSVLYDFSDLDKAENQPLRFYLMNMALLPAKAYTIRFLESLFGNREQDFIPTTQYFKPLADKGWLSFEDYTYRLSPVVQDLLLHKNKETLTTDAQPLLERLNILLNNNGSTFKMGNARTVAPYIQLIDTIGKCLIDLPSLSTASLYFKQALYGRIVGDAVAERKALEQYQATVAQLLQPEPNNPAFLQEKATAHSLFGDFYLRLGDARKAEENYSQGLSINRNLAALDEGNTSWQQDLATSLSKMGDFLIQEGKIEGIERFTEAKSIHESLLQKDPNNVQYQFDYALDFLRIGNVLKMAKHENAKDWLESGRDILLQLCQQVPEEVNFKEHLEMVEGWLEELE